MDERDLIRRLRSRPRPAPPDPSGWIDRLEAGRSPGESGRWVGAAAAALVLSTAALHFAPPPARAADLLAGGVATGAAMIDAVQRRLATAPPIAPAPETDDEERSNR